MTDPSNLQPAQTPPAAPTKQGDTKFATVSLVLGILSLLLPFVGLLLGILAIVYYVKQKKIGPNGNATAGLVCGIIGIVSNAILFLVIGLFMVAYLGVMSTDRYLPDKCVAAPPFTCTEFRATSEGVSLLLQNNGGYDMQNVSVVVDNCGTSPVTAYVANGEMIPVTISCPVVPPTFTSPFTITYTNLGYGSTRTATGSVSMRIDNQNY